MGPQEGQQRLAPHHSCPPTPTGLTARGWLVTLHPLLSLPTWPATWHTRGPLYVCAQTPALLQFLTSCRNARVSVNRLTGLLDVTLFSRFLMQIVAENTHKCRCRRQRCPSATITACPSPVTVATANAQAESPPPISPPAKRTRKRRCEVELLREGEEDSSLLLTPPLNNKPSP
jgi:hypothetical protein